MRNIRREKGAITIITVVTILFIVSFLISTYIIIANKVKSQKQMIEETREIYESKETMEEVYNSYFNKGNIIPIYTAEELLKIGKEENNVNINGKYYDFNNKEDTIYVLMNDIRFRASDYADKITDGYWLPIGNNQKLKAKFEGQNHKIEVIYDDNTREYTYSNRYADTGKWRIPKGIKVGDYINYTPDVGTYRVVGGEYGSGYDTVQTFTTEINDNKLKWKIYSIDESNGSIELISTTVAQDHKKLFLKGADGYNHAVEILNDMCNTLYSKTINGEKVAVGRSINVEDINKKTTFNINSGDYGKQKKLSDYAEYARKFPNLCSKEEGFYMGESKNQNGISESERYDEGQVTIIEENSNKIKEYSYKKLTGYADDSVENKNISLTYNYFSYATEEELKSNIGINNLPIGILAVETEYWIASRDINISDANSFAYFDLRSINSEGWLHGNYLFFSNGYIGTQNYAVRPLVSIKNYNLLEKDTENSDSTNTHWNLYF